MEAGQLHDERSGVRVAGLAAGAGLALVHAAEIDAVHRDAVEGVPAQSQTPNALQIRRGVEQDREGVRALLRQHHLNSVFRAQAFADWKFDTQFDHFVQHPKNTLGLVAEHQRRIVGAAWAVCDQYMLSDGPPFVSVQLIAVELQAINALGRTKTFLGLIKAIRQWTTAMNATNAQIHVTSGKNLEATDQLLKAAGARSVGGSYVR